VRDHGLSGGVVFTAARVGGLAWQPVAGGGEPGDDAQGEEREGGGNERGDPAPESPVDRGPPCHARGTRGERGRFTRPAGWGWQRHPLHGADGSCG
jgi:hypothetical protein